VLRDETAPARSDSASIQAAADRPVLLPASSNAARRPGSRERGGSPWLGRGDTPSASFQAWQAIERSLAAWLPMPAAAVAPATAAGAFLDWWTHLLASPAKQWELAQAGLEQWLGACRATATGCEASQPLPQDKRFDDAVWQQQPYRALEQAFLLQEQWWQRATTGVPGVTRHHEQMVSFAARQWLDMAAPSNFISTNPVVRRRTAQEGGMNLLRGLAHTLDDTWREAADLPPAGAEAFEVGRNVAITPGRIVLRNRLMELIQYTPTTPRVHAEPVLIVPAWIMKYYVLDLSPHDSLIKHLVDHGFTVFAISWKNPDAEDRDLGMNDYDELGVRAALQAIRTIVPDARVHATGYCLGGTLLAIAAAALGRDGDPALKTLTLLAAQTDFTDPGEIALFIDEGQVTHLEKLMWQRGVLDKAQMKRTFQMLRSNDLIWSHRVHNLLLGERRAMSDLMAWNADGTRLPYRMHIEYLRGLFLRNALARGEWVAGGAPVNLGDIRVPIFNLGAVQDHVAPWRSVFKLNALTDAEQTFVLTAGGHNVGIVNPPGQALSSHRRRDWKHGERLLTPDEWLEATPSVPGSWWTPWVEWLAQHSSRQVAPPPMAAPAAGLRALEAAPGRYVLRR
jgi:polyhydroxyalkanoate synthase subunit PhaC